MFVLGAVAGGVYWFIRDKVNGGQVRTEKSKVLKQVEKAEQAINNYMEKMERLNKAVRDYQADEKNLNVEGKKARWRECIRVASDIDPFSPAGVDPEVARAIRRKKEILIAEYSAILESFDIDSTNPDKLKDWRARSDSLRDARNKADADLREALNKLYAKYSE